MSVSGQPRQANNVSTLHRSDAGETLEVPNFELPVAPTGQHVVASTDVQRANVRSMSLYLDRGEPFRLDRVGRLWLARRRRERDRVRLERVGCQVEQKAERRLDSRGRRRFRAGVRRERKRLDLRRTVDLGPEREPVAPRVLLLLRHRLCLALLLRRSLLATQLLLLNLAFGSDTEDGERLVRGEDEEEGLGRVILDVRYR